MTTAGQEFRRILDWQANFDAADAAFRRGETICTAAGEPIDRETLGFGLEQEYMELQRRSRRAVGECADPVIAGLLGELRRVVGDDAAASDRRQELRGQIWGRAGELVEQERAGTPGSETAPDGAGEAAG